MDQLIASIMLWPLGWVPVDWLPCDGRTLMVQQYNALFALLGTTYGGNGSTNFMLPNLCGRVPLGVGLSPDSGTTYAIAANGGSEASVVPQHVHAFSSPAAVRIMASAAVATSPIPTTAFNTIGAPYDATAGNSVLGYNNAAPAVALNTGNGNVTISGNTGANGVVATHANMQPYLTLSYIICVNGIYPQRP
jgi:microcystin-dependent protein